MTKHANLRRIACA